VRGRTRARSPYSEAANLPRQLQGTDVIPSTRSRFLRLGPSAAAEHASGSLVPPSCEGAGRLASARHGGDGAPRCPDRQRAPLSQGVQGKSVSTENTGYSPYLHIPQKQSSFSLWQIK